jgi:hypothetical protein
MRPRGPALDFLQAKCHEWGGKLILCSEDEFDWWARNYGVRWIGNEEVEGKFWVAPFIENHGVFWREKKILVVENSLSLGATIHEMGHCFASRNPPHRGEDEFSWMGWEVAVAYEANCYRTWSGQNAEYTIDLANTPWGQLPAVRKSRIVKERISHAKKIGVVNAQNRAVSVR